MSTKGFTVLAIRSFLLLALVLLLFASLRSLYRAIFLDPRCDAIERDIARWYNDDFEENDNDDDGDGGGDFEKNDTVDRRDRLTRLRRRLGVGLDSLPSVRFESKSDGTVRDDNDENDDDETTALQRQRECLSYGAFVSEQDEYTDCRAYCNVSDGVVYRYYDKLGQLLNGRRGRVGGYCMPTDAAICNTNTSITVYGKTGWRCMPQMRAFAGEGGNLIVACDGRLLDRATGRVWYKHIDPTLALDSVDEYLPGTRDYRFVCLDTRDYRGNLRIEAPFDRLIQLDNVCASLIPNASDDIAPDFERHRCDCGKSALYDETLRLCVPRDTAAPSRDPDECFNSRTLEASVDPTPQHDGSCWEPWMTISQARSLENARTLCGVEYENSDSGGANPGFMRTRAFIFDRPVPSPAAMLISSERIAAG